MPYYGVIDLGSNSVRLVVYNVNEQACAPYSKKDFRIIIDEKEVAGLSAYVQDGIFSEDGIAKATQVLSEHLRCVGNFDCKKVSIFATAVLRNCINSQEATRTISKNIKKSIDILSEHDEAHLGFVGATFDRSIGSGTLVDIGGGSTELSHIVGGNDIEGISIAQGSVSSYAKFVDKILPTRKEMHTIESAFRRRLKKVKNLKDYRAKRLFGIGGAPRATMKIYQAAFANDQKQKNLTVEQIHNVLTLLADSPHDFAHVAVKAVPERLHTLIPGCLIIITLMRELETQTLEICKFGVREGYLIERILKPNNKTKEK